MMKTSGRPTEWTRISGYKNDGRGHCWWLGVERFTAGRYNWWSMHVGLGLAFCVGQVAARATAFIGKHLRCLGHHLAKKSKQS